MSLIFLFFALSVRADTWTLQDVQRMMRNPAINSENQYLSSLCEVQLQQHRIPTACFQESQNNQSMLRFLNERCEQWIGGEKNLEVLKNWSEHPHLHKNCFTKVQERIAELEYIQEEHSPLEYFRAQKSQLARNLKSKAIWKPRNHKRSDTNYLSASGKD